MNIESIGDGLKVALAEITTISAVYAPKEIPDTLNSSISALILPGETEFDETFGDDHSATFRIIIVLGKNDQPSALNKILDYITPTGVSSVLAALKADRTLGGACEDLKVLRNLGTGSIIWGGIVYLSTEFEVIVYYTS